MEQGEANAEVEGCYLLTGPPPFSVPKRKLAFSQPELLLCEILYLRERPVISVLNGTELAVHYIHDISIREVCK